jgi:uncharacterized membrane protein
LPHAFVNDHKERIEDINDFFQAETSLKKYIHILKKYQPKYVLFNKADDKNWLFITKGLIFSEVGQLVYENEIIAMYKIDPTKLDCIKAKFE